MCLQSANLVFMDRTVNSGVTADTREAVTDLRAACVTLAGMAYNVKKKVKQGNTVVNGFSQYDQNKTSCW